MTPDEIHRIGLDEVKRIRDEMQTIIAEVEFDGSFQDFLSFLRTDPQFYFDNPEDLYQEYLATSKRIDPELVKLFGKLPRMPYGVKPIPDSIAPDTTTAYYNDRLPMAVVPGSTASISTSRKCGPSTKSRYSACMRPCPGITCRLRCSRNSVTCRCSAASWASRHLSRAGACTASASATTWACTRTRTRVSAS